jgi:PAS domain S-box-containing protein
MDNECGSRDRVSEEIVQLRRRIKELEARLEEIANESREIRLLDELTRSRDALEKRVEERTSDLVRMNERLTEEIEERKSVEEALWESEQRFRQIYENAPVMLHSIDVCGVLRNVNQKWLTVMGFKRGEVIGKTIDFVMTPESRQALSVILPEFWRDGKVSDVRYSYIKKSGTIIDIVLDSVVIYDSVWGIVSLSVVRDVTETKKAAEALRESEERYRQLFEVSPLAMTVHKGNEILFSNSAAAALHGAEAPEALIGRGLPDYIHPDHHQWYQEVLRNIVEKQKPGAFTPIKLVSLDGKITHVEWASVPTTYKGAPAILSVGRDITEVKRAEERLTAGLLEKEVLLREIHHRVKNNLQVVSSLLRLQSRFACDAVSREALAASEQRLYSMACVHENLYRSADLARIDFSRYVSNLASHLMASHGVTDEISLEEHMDPVELGVDIAIPCGLIANELISNSLRHAFPQGRTGAVKIELKKTGSSAFDLTVRDNGIGLPSEMDFNSSPSFGSRLVQSLIRQVNGQMVINGSGGTEFRVSFPETGNGRH